MRAFAELIPQVPFTTFATNVLTSDTTNVADAATVVIGDITYRFKSTMAQAYDVKIGADADTSLANLVAAINGTGTAGTEYYAGTEVHPDVRASAVSAHASTITAVLPGFGANSLVTTGATHLTFATETMGGGVGGPVTAVDLEEVDLGDDDTFYTEKIDVSQYTELIAFLNVTAKANDTGTLDIKFQISPDGQNWVDSGDALAQVTDTLGVTFKRMTANFGQYIRAAIALGGTDPEFTATLRIIGKE